MTARNTSAEAYARLGDKGATDRKIIAELVRKRGPMTRREIAGFLHMETSSVAGRVNELMHDGVLIEQDDLRPRPFTGRKVNWLAHSEHSPGFQMGPAV